VRRGKAHVSPQFSQLKHSAQPPKRCIRPGGIVDVAILGFECPGWAEVMEMIAHWGDQYAALQKIRGTGGEHADESIKEVRLNFLPPPSLVTMR
jgi:hypothetical protein